MEFFKSQLNRIQQQLAGLTSSQKMLVGALVVIMVMTLLYSARYAGTAEMEPLLDQSFNGEEIARITSKLDGMGISQKVVGDKILVPADRKMQVIAVLGYEQMLPSNTQQGFAELVKQINPFSSASITDAQLNDAKSVTLSNVIRRFPGVRDATVVVDPSNKRVIGEVFTPSAMVYITTKQPGGKPNKQLVEAAAAVVAGSQSGLARGNVTVVVDGISRKVDDPNAELDGGLGSGEVLERTQAFERYLTQKIAEQISFIPDPKISVTVELQTSSTRERLQEYDKKKTFNIETGTENRTEESTTAGQPSNEPGALTNTTMIVPGAGGAGGSSNTTTEEKTTLQAFPTVREANISTPAGKPTVVAATVRVPQSYFSSVWMRKNPGGKEPSDDVIRTMADAELPKIRTDVMNCTGLKDPMLVSVETYADTLPMLAAVGGAAPAGTASSLPLSIASYGKEIAIGVLALVSLFMVTTMVKKSTPAPVVLGAVSEPPAPQLVNGEAIAGEVGAGDQLLDGMELDEDAVRAQQMLDQVTTMVKENPESAASLVKRWMNRT